jgi:hypothetical protein
MSYPDELIPYRPDRRSRDRRKRGEVDLERTQFRAMGWSLRRSKAGIAKKADAALAVLIVGAAGAAFLVALALPVVVVVQVVKWAL